MKKLLLSSLVITSIFAFAYSPTDVDNANYLAEKNIITKQIYEIKYRLDDSITRAEVVGIALKMRGATLPENYTCKNYFSDVKFIPFSNDQWICRAVELGADAGFVSRTNTRFRSQDKITRAEALAIILKSAQINLISDEELIAYDKEQQKNSQENTLCTTEKLFCYPWLSKEWGTDVKWIQKLLLTVVKKIPEIFRPYNTDSIEPRAFYPTNIATRAEVFGFAKNILEYKAMMSGEVTVQ